MEIEEFSKRILFGPSVEDKLFRPQGFSDDAPGDGLSGTVVPARPPGLELHGEGRARFEFPGVHELDDELTRGRALHFFANHELMALELMALAMLRFPDAPPAFRRTLLGTIIDEQKHLGLYLDRMKSLGVELGDIPVNSFFWDGLSGIQSPVDYVAQLSMVFEQANLDFARHYADLFATMGDDATSSILQEIYEDEIGHVRVGLNWFRHWSGLPPEASDDAERLFARHESCLGVTINLARARGPIFDVEGRRRAGLPEGYIERLRRFRASKGRPPRVHLYAHPPELHRLGVDEERDLELLPLFAAAPDDVMLVDRSPSPEFLAQLEAAGFSYPRFVAPRAGQAVDATALAHRRCGALEPWTWTQSTAQRLRRDLALFDVEDEITKACEVMSVVSHDLEKASSLAEDFVRACAQHDTRRAWVDGWLIDGVPVAEDVRKICELRASFEVTPHGEGIARRVVRLYVDEDGVRGGYLGGLSATMPERVRRFSHGNGREANRITKVLDAAIDTIARRLSSHGYVGPASIGAQIVELPSQGYRLVPLSSVDVGWSVAHLMRGLSSHLSHSRVGLWGCVPLSNGCEEAQAIADRMARQLPLQCAPGQDGKSQRIVQGSLCTNDPARANRVLTLMLVGRDYRELEALFPARGIARSSS